MPIVQVSLRTDDGKTQNKHELAAWMFNEYLADMNK